MKIRNLFCLASGALSGGNKILLELASSLSKAGQVVDVFFWDNRKLPNWFPGQINALPSREITEALRNDYDLVYFANAFLVPLALPHLRSARGVLISQGYESYCYGSSLDECLKESQALSDIMRLPIPVIATSKSVQQIFKRQLNKDSYYVPVGIDDRFFVKARTSTHRSTNNKRILMVGNYLQKCKAMQDGFEAIKIVAQDIPVTLVLVTQQKPNNKALNKLGLDIVVHHMPDRIVDIFQSCDVYCCSSWYEGFGLPAIESFACGIPVVSSRNCGVTDFGIDGVNLLLAEPNTPIDLSKKIKLVLNNQALSQSLIQNGRKTAERFRYENMTRAFMDTQQEILSLPPQANFENKQERMSSLLLNLEQEGVFTPLHIQHELALLSKELQDVIAVMSVEGSPTTEAKKQLELIRNKLEPYLAKRTAEYFPAFKSRFDTCQFVLSIADEPNLHKFISLLRTGNMS